MVLRSRTGSARLISRPLTMIRPLVGTSSLLIIRSVVVFPDPEGPMRTHSSPAEISRETSSTARMVLVADRKIFETRSSVIMDAGVGDVMVEAVERDSEARLGGYCGSARGVLQPLRRYWRRGPRPPAPPAGGAPVGPAALRGLRRCS